MRRNLSDPTKTISYANALLVEVAILLFITIATLSLVSAGNSGFTAANCAENASFKIIPYIRFNYPELCGNARLLVTLAAYQLLFAATAIAFQIVYFRGRGRLRVENWRLFIGMGVLLASMLTLWAVGAPGSIKSHSHRIHEGALLTPIMMCLVVPAFQFFISIGCLRGDGA